IEAGSKPDTHFDTKDWKNWKQLKGNETGLGWDSTKKTIDASEEWWAKRLAVSLLKLSLVIPKAKKFRKEGIHPDFEATMDR
ncbi:hypothetical protein S245_040672, partial [Arachis hypogaea]